MIHLEKDWDAPKLEKKLHEYFKKGPKNMSFKNTGLEDLVNEYADNVMASIFAGLGDREWLYSGQVDFLLCVDAGIKDSFPGVMLRNVAQTDFEQMVLGAYERAFDEQRFCPLLTEAVTSSVQGPKAKKKVWNAIDESRKETVLAGHNEVADFTATWINHAVRLLSAASQGCPEATYEPASMAQLFQTLLESGALPTAMGVEQVPLHVVEPSVDAAYIEHTAGEDEAWEPAPKKMKAASLGAGYGADPLATAVAWGKGATSDPADIYGPPAGASGYGGGKDVYGPPTGGKGAYGGGKEAYGPPASSYGRGAAYGKGWGGGGDGGWGGGKGW